jgi:ferritin
MTKEFVELGKHLEDNIPKIVEEIKKVEVTDPMYTQLLEAFNATMTIHGSIQELLMDLIKAQTEKKDEVKEDGINN